MLSSTITDGLTLDGTATLGSATSYSYATLSFSGSQTLGGTGDVVFGDGGSQISVSDNATLTIGPGITIHGQAGTIGSSFNSETVVNQGKIGADVTGGILTVGATTLRNQGTVGSSNGGSLIVSGLADNAGTISVGVGSEATFNGGLDQESPGTVAVNVGGVASGLYGSLSVSGGATFAGTLDVSLVSGYSPQVNDSIPIITFDTGTGQFATVNVSNLPAGIAANVVYGSSSVTLLFGNALKANAAVSVSPGMQPKLLPSELAPVVAEAIDGWVAAGVDPAELAQLRQLQFQIVDLPDAELGMQDGNTVWIDQDAAGHGWYLETTLGSDREFFRSTAGGELQALAGSPAYGRMDLLTVVEHEMGHVLGLAENGNPEGIMGETLEAGIRRLPILPSAGQSSVSRSSQINAGAAQTTTLTTGLGQTSLPAKEDLRATPVLAEAVDHLLQTGELSSRFPVTILDHGKPVPAGVKTVSLRRSARVASTPVSVLTGRSPRFTIAGARKSRLTTDSIARLSFTGKLAGE